jgi:hypothetical protein
MHDEDAVGEHRRQIEVVQYRHHAPSPPREIPRYVHDDQLVLDIEA